MESLLECNDEKKMSIEQMKKLIPETEQIEFKEIPASLDAIVMETESNKDKTGKNCFYITWKVFNDGPQKGKTFVSKYSGYHIPSLIKALESLKIKGFEIGQLYHIELKTFSMGYPRHIPTEIKLDKK